MTYKCVVCGAEKKESIPKNVHEHTYADVWSSDEYVHWYAASCGHELRYELAVHSWDDGEVISLPTESSDGETRYTCVICGYESIRKTPALAHNHTYSDAWSSDEYVHWYAADCGHDIKVNLAVHNWDNGTVITAPTEESEGQTKYTCVICGFEKTETIPAIAHTHVFDNKWSSDEDTHWIGTTCGHDIKSDIAVHIWDNGTVITEPTEDAEGEMLYKCLICKGELYY